MKLFIIALSMAAFGLFSNTLQAQSCCSAKKAADTKSTCNQASSSTASSSDFVQEINWVLNQSPEQAKDAKTCTPADCKPADKNCNPAQCQPSDCGKSNKASLKKQGASSTSATAVLVKKSE